MVKTFVASSGIEITEFGHVEAVPEGCDWLEVHEARAEFYRHLRDKECNRFRHPAFPQFVLYHRHPTSVLLIDETTGAMWNVGIDDDLLEGSDQGDVIESYRCRLPKDWENADPGETWMLELKGERKRTFGHVRELAEVKAPGRLPFFDALGRAIDPMRIESGIRVWSGECDAR